MKMASDSLTESIRKKLIGKIVAGELLPGDHIVEAEIASELGVSRTPVRDALQALMTHGILVRRAHHGCFVAEPGPLDLSRALQAREALEGMAARLMASEHSVEDVAQLRELHEMMIAASSDDDYFGYRTLHYSFHSQIIRGSRNEYIEYYSGVELFILKCLINYPLSFVVPDMHVERPISHMDIISAIQASDADAAETAMRGHIAHTRARLLRWRERNRDRLKATGVELEYGRA